MSERSKFSFLYALFVTNLSAYGKRIHPQQPPQCRVRVVPLEGQSSVSNCLVSGGLSAKFIRCGEHQTHHVLKLDDHKKLWSPSGIS